MYIQSAFCYHWQYKFVSIYVFICQFNYANFFKKIEGKKLGEMFAV